MKYILIIIGLAGFIYTANSQIVTIKDKDTEQPLDLATIISETPKAFATTNYKGQANIETFKNSKQIQVRCLGYKTQLLSFSDIADNNFIIMMQSTNLNLDEVVVSATRWRQTSGNIPAKIISIQSKDIELQNPQTAADLLSISGKVYIQKSQQGGGSPMIRGFATNRLLYTIDGVRMNTAIFRGGNIQNVINIDPFSIENTEVLFGPGSVIYGSDAIGGVMSFNTIIPELSLDDKPLITGKVLGRYSSANNENTAHFDVNIGWKKWSIVTSFSSWSFDHLKQGQHGPDDYLKPHYTQYQDSIDRVIKQEDPLLQIPSGYSQYNMLQKIRFKPNNAWDFTYSFIFSETSPYGRYDRHNRIKNGLPKYGEWNYGPQKWMMNLLNITHTSNKGIYDELTIRGALQNFEESRIDRGFNKTDRTTNREMVDAYSINFDFHKNIGTKNALYYGGEYILNDITSTGIITDITTNINTTGPSRYPNSNWQSMGVYITDNYKLSEKLNIQGGIRYNKFVIDAVFDTTFYPFNFTKANIDNNAITGSLGLIYRPMSSWVLSTNFGTAFRSPNIDDIGKVFDSEPGAVTIPNPDLDAEYAYNFDVSIAKVFNKMVKFDITGYYTILNNALVRRDFKINGLDSILYAGEMSKVQAIQNAAVANVYGLQAGIEVDLPQGFRFSSDFNYQKGEEELDNGTISPSRHAAPIFGSSRLGYKTKNLYFQFYAVYQGEKSYANMAEDEKNKDEIYAKDNNGNNYAPAWYSLNLKTSYNFSKYLSITSGLENITDQRYRPYSSGISAPGRQFILSLKASF